MEFCVLSWLYLNMVFCFEFLDKIFGNIFFGRKKKGKRKKVEWKVLNFIFIFFLKN